MHAPKILLLGLIRTLVENLLEQLCTAHRYWGNYLQHLGVYAAGDCKAQFYTCHAAGTEGVTHPRHTWHLQVLLLKPLMNSMCWLQIKVAQGCIDWQMPDLVHAVVLRYVRHPGYLGFFMWCVGTQLLLVNPVCCVVFTLVVSALLDKSSLHQSTLHMPFS